MDEMIYLTCVPCKVGKRVPMEDQLNEKNDDRDKFFGSHLKHGNIEVNTEEYFRQKLMGEGFKDNDDENIQPIATHIGSKEPVSSFEVTKIAPFGMPKDAEIAHEEENIGIILQRPTWDEYFLRIAEVVAQRGTCSRLQVGAVLVKDNKIIATGYNGAPSRLPHCDHRLVAVETEDDYADAQPGDMINGHCAVAEHAERNALLACDRPKEGATMYVTVSPCLQCARNMVTAGITRIVYRSSYRPDEEVSKLADKAGIVLTNKGPE